MFREGSLSQPGYSGRAGFLEEVVSKQALDSELGVDIPVQRGRGAREQGLQASVLQDSHS